MKVFVPKETAEFEKRVAATPDSVRKLVKLGLAVTVESGAGEAADFLDSQYVEAGCGDRLCERCGHYFAS